MKKFDEVKRLAGEIDQFAYDLDPYKYRDNHNSRSEGTKSILMDLMSGRVDVLIQWFQNVADVGESKESIKEAVRLVEQLKLYDVENRLFISVMSYEENTDKLSDFPHIQKGEFVIVSQFSVGDKNEFEEYTAYLTVTHKMRESWNMSVKELFDAAVENSKVLYPGEIKELNAYTEKQVNNELFLKPDGTAVPETYVLTNKTHFNGAAVLFYQPELLDSLAKRLDMNCLALIPTGSNEIYVIAMDENDNVAKLTELKSEVDATLSESVVSQRVMTYYSDSHMVKEYDGEELSLSVTDETNMDRDMEMSFDVPAR